MRYGLKMLCLAVMACAMPLVQAEEQTFAEKLGWPKGARVLMIHADDAGMSYASNRATIETSEAGPVTSASVMVTCSWAPDYVAWLKENPDFCAGVHLTFTSEWRPYRWGPVAGRDKVPGLLDPQGYFYHNVGDVVANATADEIEIEIRAQIALAEQLGIDITHIDSHMGTLYASPAFFERYMKVAIEKQIPFLIAGGHLTQTRKEQDQSVVESLQHVVPVVWEAGLPVLDDIDTRTYGWKSLDKRDELVDAIRTLPPGVTWLNVHPTLPNDEGKRITNDRETVFGDYLSLIDPIIMETIKEEGVILTSWRELKERRDAVK